MNSFILSSRSICDDQLVCFVIWLTNESGQQATNCLSVFDYFLGLVRRFSQSQLPDAPGGGFEPTQNLSLILCLNLNPDNCTIFFV